MDPENCIDDEYNPKHNKTYVWRGLRLLASEQLVGMTDACGEPFDTLMVKEKRVAAPAASAAATPAAAAGGTSSCRCQTVDVLLSRVDVRAIACACVVVIPLEVDAHRPCCCVKKPVVVDGPVDCPVNITGVHLDAHVFATHHLIRRWRTACRGKSSAWVSLLRVGCPCLHVVGRVCLCVCQVRSTTVQGSASSRTMTRPRREPTLPAPIQNSDQ